MKTAFQSTIKYLAEVWNELTKVSWPIKKGKNLSFYDRCGELLESVVAVLITVAVFAVFIAAVDLVFSKFIDRLVS